jgi:hypothetical protein
MRTQTSHTAAPDERVHREVTRPTRVLRETTSFAAACAAWAGFALRREPRSPDRRRELTE